MHTSKLGWLLVGKVGCIVSSTVFSVALSTIIADSLHRSMWSIRIHFWFTPFLLPQRKLHILFVSTGFGACILRSTALCEEEHLHFEERSMGWQTSPSSCRSSVHLRLAPVKCLLPSDRNLGPGVNDSYPAIFILSLSAPSATDALDDSLEISLA